MPAHEKRLSFRDYIKEVEEQAAAEDAALWGNVAGMQTGVLDPLSNSPNFKAICAILRETPILVQPTLRWLQRKRAEMASAQLSVLYSPEEILEMKKELPEEK